MTPEEKARQQIDAQLTLSGWAVQNYTKFDPSASRGIALREVPLKGGRCDYLLLIKFAGAKRVLFLVDRSNLGHAGVVPGSLSV